MFKKTISLSLTNNYERFADTYSKLFNVKRAKFDGIVNRLRKKYSPVQVNYIIEFIRDIDYSSFKSLSRYFLDHRVDDAVLKELYTTSQTLAANSEGKSLSTPYSRVAFFLIKLANKLSSRLYSSNQDKQDAFKKIFLEVIQTLFVFSHTIFSTLYQDDANILYDAAYANDTPTGIEKIHNYRSRYLEEISARRERNEAQLRENFSQKTETNKTYYDTQRLWVEKDAISQEQDYMLSVEGHIFSPNIVRWMLAQSDKFKNHPLVLYLGKHMGLANIDGILDIALQKHIDSYLLERSIHILDQYSRLKDGQTIYSILSKQGEALLDKLQQLKTSQSHTELSEYQAYRDEKQLDTLFMQLDKQELNLALFVDIFPNTSESTLKELVSMWGLVQGISKGCPNQCIHCAVDADKKTRHLPYPIALKLMGLLKERVIFPYNDSDPLTYHDSILGADFGDFAIYAYKKWNKHYHITTTGLYPGKNSEKILSKFLQIPDQRNYEFEFRVSGVFIDKSKQDRSLKKLKHTAEILAKNGFTPEFNIFVETDKDPLINELENFLKTLGINHFGITLNRDLAPLGRARDLTSNPLIPFRARSYSSVGGQALSLMVTPEGRFIIRIIPSYDEEEPIQNIDSSISIYDPIPF